ncbi:MAG TPA: NADH-quinone oxidoreductase subunit K [Anaerolineae bacterium]|nr:NADH-quinone oxidoreductase subunit K [Anaerolineae bacterium]
MTDPQIILVGVLGLIGVGVYGLLISRNLIKVIVALQILVKGAMLAMIAAGAASGRVNLGQSLAVTIIVADTVVAVIGLALAIQIKRRVGSLDVNDLATLKK